MSSFLWLRPLAHRWFGRRGQRVSSARAAVAARQRVRPRLEFLEDRTLPTVSTTGQLIDAINAGNNSGGATTITLAKTTFDFTSPFQDTRNALPIITGNITIIGNGGTIERDSGAKLAFRLFNVASGGSLTLQDVTLQGGLAQGNPFLGQASAEGGAVYSSGTLNLSGVTVEKNQALGFDGANAASAAGMNGQDAYGGGIYIAGGSAGLSNDTLNQNSALGGFGGHGGNSGNGNGLSGGNGGEGAGGGIYLAAGSVSLSNGTRVEGNAATGRAGGSGGFVTHGVGGSGGSGGDGRGGGLYAAGGSVSLSNATFDSNRADGGDGGNGGNGFVHDLGGNGKGGEGGLGGAGIGGGLYVATVNNLTLRDDTLSNNIALGGSGGTGGIGAPNTVLSNTGKGGKGEAGGIGGIAGGGAGGGVFVTASSVSLTNDTLSGNTAQGGFGGTGGEGGSGGTGGTGGLGAEAGNGAGGGLYVAVSNVNLSNDTLSGNHAYGNKGGKGGNGGAGTGTHTFLGIIISAGKGGNGGDGGLGGTGIGGGLFAGSGSIALTNTLIAENTLLAGTGGRGGTGGSAHTSGTSGTSGNAGNALDPDVDGSVSSSDHNLIGNPSGSSGFSTTHGDILNPSFIGLGPLANNGGPTQTLALLPGSPAINAGDNTAPSATQLYDQRGKGFARVANGTIDIGAFEVQRRLVLAPPNQGSGSTPSPSPPTLHTPPLLGFFDSLLAGVETVNSNGTETVTDSFFGIPLFISTYDGAGKLMSVSLFGIDITFLIEML